MHCSLYSATCKDTHCPQCCVVMDVQDADACCKAISTDKWSFTAVWLVGVTMTM
jgi:hypothetical protein